MGGAFKPDVHGFVWFVSDILLPSAPGGAALAQGIGAARSVPEQSGGMER